MLATTSPIRIHFSDPDIPEVEFKQSLSIQVSIWHKCTLAVPVKIEAVLEILLFHITNKTNLTLPYLTNLEPHFPNPSGGHQMPPSAALKLNFQHVVPYD